MTFCGDKARKGCVDSAAAFVAKEKEGENDFCLSLVIAFVTLPPKRVVDSAAFVTRTDFLERFIRHGPSERC